MSDICENLRAELANAKNIIKEEKHYLKELVKDKNAKQSTVRRTIQIWQEKVKSIRLKLRTGRCI